MNLTEEDFLRWKDDPVTEAVMVFVTNRIKGKKDDWASAAFSAPTFEETIIKNTAAIGYCDGLRDVQELTFSQLVTELSDE